MPRDPDPPTSANSNPASAGCDRPPRLCPEDEAALEALLTSRAAPSESTDPAGSSQAGSSQAGSSQAGSSQADPRRVQRISELLSLLEADDLPEPPTDLVGRAVGRVQAQRRLERAIPIETDGAWRSGVGLPVRWPELVAVAAMLLLGLALLWPVLEHNRTHAQRIACAQRLGLNARALNAYAQDHGQAMPRRAVEPGAPWYRVGEQSPPQRPARSNSAHLYLLASGGYIQPKLMNCPTNPHAPTEPDPTAHDWPNARAVSYSYQNQYTPNPLRMDRDASMAVLADKNPLFEAEGDRLLYHAQRGPEAVSGAHGGGGQNILIKRGEVLWSDRPVLRGGDNIWLIHGVKDYRGIERPAQSDDSFLVP